MRAETSQPLRRVFAPAALLAVAALLGGVLSALLPLDAPAAQAVTGSDFNAGYIVSDDNFFNGNAMSVAEIQNFLEAKEPGTCGNSMCLKNYHTDTYSIPADPMCQAYPGAGNESAATIIYKVATTCGISPKTILVTLQKEQGLITKLTPSQSAMDHAMGAMCPDTAACDPAWAGFFKQVHGGAYWMKRYTQPAGTGAGTVYYSRFDLSYPVGKTTAISTYPGNHAPNGDYCSPQAVTVQNRATHVLYVYTPYTPNAAALAHLGSTGDECSSYGNRNFWYYWSVWFGTPTASNSPYGAVTSVTSAEKSVTVKGWALDSDSTSSIGIKVAIDGVVVTTSTADATDASLLNSGVPVYWPSASGTAHAYSVTLPAPSGTHNICVWGINVAGTAGGDTSTACTVSTVAYCGSSWTCPTPDRTSGADRYSGSVAMSTAAFPSGAPVVYITNGLNFPDALSAAPAAARDGGPLLLTDPASLPPSVAAEVSRLNPTTIVVVGGPNSVAPQVLDQLATAAPTATISRVDGLDRYEASRNLAATFGDTISDLYLVTGTKFPDALSADSIGAYQHRPVLLVQGDLLALDDATRAFLVDHQVQRVTIVGGPASVSSGIESDIAAMTGVTVTRLTGADRFDASQAANRSVFTSASHVYIASGVNYPDALAGSVLAAKNGSPLYLSNSGCVPQGVLDDIRQLGATRVTLLGGPNSLSDVLLSATSPQACFP